MNVLEMSLLEVLGWIIFWIVVGVASIAVCISVGRPSAELLDLVKNPLDWFQSASRPLPRRKP